MTLNKSMSITPDTPAAASQGEVQHGSNLSGNYRPLRVSSQCNSTVITNLDGFTNDKHGDGAMVLVELADRVSLKRIAAKTQAS